MARRSRVLVSILCLMTLVAAACAGDGEGDGQEGDRERISEIIVLAEDIPAGLDYDSPAVGIPTSQTGIVNLMEGLITYGESEVNDEGIQLLDLNAYEGRLAESWEFDESTLTWTFHLRDDVVGCNGTTFNADDVLYTYARAKSVSGEVPVGWFEANTAGIEGFTDAVFEGETEPGNEVSKVDDYTVQFKQSDPPSQLFLPVLAQWAGTMIFDKETMEEHATEADPWSHDYVNNENAPSFGPYCLERWVKDSEFIVVGNPDYFRGPPAIQRVVYRKVPESSNRVAALISGDAHLVEHLTPKESDSLRSVEGVEVGGVVGNETLFLHANWSTPPFDDPLIRRALAYALPYDEIISTGYQGQATKWESQIPSIYPGYHLPSTQYEYDPAQATDLLAEAGYPDGRGLDQFGESFALTYPSEKESTLGPIATLVRDALQAVGMPVELEPMPLTQFSDRLRTKLDLPFALDDQEKAVPVDGGYALLIAHTTYGCCANNTNFADKDVDELVRAANIETDVEARNDLLAQAQQILMEHPNWIPIVERKTEWAYSSSLTGITWHPENSLRWYDLEPE